MNEKPRTHKDLDAWKKSIELVERIYSITKQFPQEELYGLTSQLRRAAVSIPSNIAEGAARGSKKDFLRFLHVALGSACEVETQMIIAQRLNYLDDTDTIEEQLEAVRRLILGLIRYLRREDPRE
jgi:four helix bundle protein